MLNVTSKITEPNPVDDDTFYDSEPLYDLTLFVPIGCKEKYSNTKGWNIFKNIVEKEFDQEPTSIKEKECDSTTEATYTLDGRISNSGSKGLHIVRMSDGSVRKVITK